MLHEDPMIKMKEQIKRCRPTWHNIRWTQAWEANSYWGGGGWPTCWRRKGPFWVWKIHFTHVWWNYWAPPPPPRFRRAWNMCYYALISVYWTPESDKIVFMRSVDFHKTTSLIVSISNAKLWFYTRNLCETGPRFTFWVSFVNQFFFFAGTKIFFQTLTL